VRSRADDLRLLCSLRSPSPFLTRRRFARRYYHSDFTHGPSPRYRGFYCALLSVETAITSKVLSAKQAWRIIGAFPADEDGIRVEAAAILFSKCVDVENFVVEVIDKLSTEEQQEAVWRIGNSNLFSPLNPDRHYWIDMTQYDDREILVKLVRLSVIEDGINIRKCTNRRNWCSDPVPGLGIQEDWEADPNCIPGEGMVDFRYVTGGARVEGEEEEESEAGTQAGSDVLEDILGMASHSTVMEDVEAQHPEMSSRATVRGKAFLEKGAEGLTSNANAEFRTLLYRECFCGTKAVY
jgi:hypothetical protein